MYVRRNETNFLMLSKTCPSRKSYHCRPRPGRGRKAARLGLLKYHAALPRNAERLFPNLPIHDSKGKRGPTLGRAFNNWRRNLGINYKDRPLDFHSLRHTFGKMMEDLGISEPDRARLLGHAVPGIGASVYSAPELKRVAPLVAEVKWEGLEIP